MYFSPLEQFIVDPKLLIFFNDFYFSLTNFSILALMTIFSLHLFTFLLMDNYKINNLYFFALKELTFFFERLSSSIVGKKEGRNYFSLILTLFLYIASLNIMGLVPFTQTMTSHCVVTLSLSFTLFLSLTWLGLVVNKEYFFALFIHWGTSKEIAPFLAIIEMISYVFRPISLGVRLFVNIMAGHVLIKVFVGFFFIFVQSSFIIMIIPQLVIFSSVSILILLELVIAILQSYIFTLLTCMYINDALNIH